jgi:hypothetical protein
MGWKSVKTERGNGLVVPPAAQRVRCPERRLSIPPRLATMKGRVREYSTHEYRSFVLWVVVEIDLPRLRVAR